VVTNLIHEEVIHMAEKQDGTRRVGPVPQGQPGKDGRVMGDEQRGGVTVHVDPSYTAKSGAQVDKEAEARPYLFAVEGEFKK